MRYIIRTKKMKNKIEEFEDLEDAISALNNYAKEDNEELSTKKEELEDKLVYLSDKCLSLNEEISKIDKEQQKLLDFYEIYDNIDNEIINL